MKWAEYKNNIKIVLDKLEIDNKILNLLKESKNKGNKIFIAGNGGSGATAAHYSCDFSLGASKPDYLNNWDRFNVIPLTTNMPLILALANDFGYDEIFKQQLINLAKPGDILIAISGSGKSENIINAVRYAKENGIKVIGICGYDGGKLKKLSDYVIHAESHIMEVCEDIHSIIGHFVTLWLRENQ